MIPAQQTPSHPDDLAVILERLDLKVRLRRARISVPDEILWNLDALRELALTIPDRRRPVPPTEDDPPPWHGHNDP